MDSQGFQEIEINTVRSSRRLRTVSARLVRNTLLIRAPLAISQERLDKIINKFKLRFEKKRLKSCLDRNDNLIERAQRINEEYFANRLKVNSIKYVTNQNSRFGCCNYRCANIRISHRIGLMPEWVRDYVILHEMAHLIEPNHSKAFWDIISRYKLAERAKGYLMGVGFNNKV
jgi:biotin synthase-like enzyme